MPFTKEETREREPKPDDQGIAVAVGRSFAIVPRSTARHIRLRPSSESVEVGGKAYRLHKGASYGDSRLVDALLDKRGEMPIRNFTAYPGHL